LCTVQTTTGNFTTSEPQQNFVHKHCVGTWRGLLCVIDIDEMTLELCHIKSWHSIVK